MKTFIAICLFATLASIASSAEYGTEPQLPLLEKRSGLRRFRDFVMVSLLVNQDAFFINEFNETERVQLSPNRAVFFPEVDRFSQLNIPGTGQQFKNYTDIYIELNVGGINSSARFYKKNDVPDKFVGFFTALIRLNRGEIIGIEWDEGCGECSDRNCIDLKNCGIGYEEINDCADPQFCNLMVYLAWIGTDDRGTPCTSPSLVPSRFQRFSFFPIYKSAAGISKSYWYDSQPGYEITPNEIT